MKTIHDPRYIDLITHLIRVRRDKMVNQAALAERLGIDRTNVSKVENLVRRLDFIELYDWLNALDCKLEDFLKETGYLKR